MTILLPVLADAPNYPVSVDLLRILFAAPQDLPIIGQYPIYRPIL
jgi:hypothetical protein